MSASEAYTNIEDTRRVTKDEIHYQIDGQNSILVKIIVLTHAHKKYAVIRFASAVLNQANFADGRCYDC